MDKLNELTNRLINNDAYRSELKRIKLFKGIITAVAVFCLIIVLFNGMYLDFTFTFNGAEQGYYKLGWPIWLTLFELFVVYAFYRTSSNLLRAGANFAFNTEGNPEKFFTLAAACENFLTPKEVKYSARYIASFYLGKFDQAVLWADRLISTRKDINISLGLYNKIKAWFFLGNYGIMRECITQYYDSVKNIKSKRKLSKLQPKSKDIAISLFLAIADNDKEKISAYSKLLGVEIQSASLTSQTFYLKGVSSYLCEEYSDAARWFKLALECCDSSVFKTLSHEYLNKLGDHANTDLYGTLENIEFAPYADSVKKYQKRIASAVKAPITIAAVFEVIITVFFALALLTDINIMPYAVAILFCVVLMFVGRKHISKAYQKVWDDISQFIMAGEVEEFLIHAVTSEIAVEGVPHKLNSRATATMLSGNFEQALFYTNASISVVPQKFILPILFDKARIEFFLGKHADMQETISRFRFALNNQANQSEKDMHRDKQLNDVLKLLESIVADDKPAIAACCAQLTPWHDKSVAVLSQVEYFKGLAAYHCGNNAEAASRFTKAIQIGKNIVYARLAQEHLNKL